MAVVTGTQGATATPATTLWATIEAALAGNANWTQSGITNPTLSAADAGTTAACEIWKNTSLANAFYMCFEIDDTNARIRVRVAEAYETNGAAVKKVRQPAGGGAVATTTDATSVTPTANDTVTDSDVSWGSTNPNVAYIQLNVSAGGYSYLYKVENKLLTVATRSAGVNSFVVVGNFTSLSTLYSDTHPVMLLGHAYTAIAWTPTTGAQRTVQFTRSPGQGAVAVAGAFSGGVAPLHRAIFEASPTPANTDAQMPFASTVASKFFANTTLVTTAMVHHANAGSIAAARAFRGYMPDFGVGLAAGAPTEPAVGDTVVVDGTTYYWLGCSFGMGASLVNSDPLLCVKG